MRALPATAADAEAGSLVLRRSILELCCADHGGDPAVLAAWTIRKTPDGWRAWLARPNAALLVAESKNEVTRIDMIDDAGVILLTYALNRARQSAWTGLVNRGMQMPLIELASKIRVRHDCWYPRKLNLSLSYLTKNEASLIVAWIDNCVFDAALQEPHRKMNVTTAIRIFCPNAPDWTGTDLQPLYDKTGQDATYAAMMYGNLVCRVAIKRPEFWICYGESVRSDGDSRTYMEDGPLYHRMIAAI